jgi:hypothetical protein
MSGMRCTLLACLCALGCVCPGCIATGLQGVALSWPEQKKVTISPGAKKGDVKRVGLMCQQAPTMVCNGRPRGFMSPVQASTHPKQHPLGLRYCSVLLYPFTLGWLLPEPRCLYDTYEGWNTGELAVQGTANTDLSAARIAALLPGRTEQARLVTLLQQQGCSVTILPPDPAKVTTILEQHKQDLDAVCVVRLGAFLDVAGNWDLKCAEKRGYKRPDYAKDKWPAKFRVTVKGKLFATKTGSTLLSFATGGRDFVWADVVRTPVGGGWSFTAEELNRAYECAVANTFSDLDLSENR